MHHTLSAMLTLVVHFKQAEEPRTMGRARASGIGADLDEETLGRRRKAKEGRGRG